MPGITTPSSRIGRSSSIIPSAPLKQELHKCLPGAFQKVLTDKHAASVRHAEGGAFQILRVFQIYDHAAPAHKKACVIL